MWKATYLATHGLRAYEGDVLDARGSRKSNSLIRITANDLNEVGVVSTGFKAAVDNANEPVRRPYNLLGALEDNSISSEKTSDNRRPCIMQS